MSSWTCTKCGAALSVPSDPALAMSRCDFCGEDNVAPDLERRQQLQVERLRAEEKRRQDDLERLRIEEKVQARLAAENAKRSENRGLYWSIGLGAVGIVVALVINAVAPTPTGDSGSTKPKPSDARSTGKTKVKEVVDGKKKHGCRVINEARTADDVVTISDWKLPKGSCVTIVAATGIDDNTLAIQFFDADDAPVSKKHQGKELVEVYCSKETAKYGYRIWPAATMPFTFEELQCEDE